MHNDKVMTVKMDDGGLHSDVTHTHLMLRYYLVDEAPC